MDCYRMKHTPAANEKVIGNYSYSPTALVGSGYSSSVYRGRTLQTGQPVAIKVVELKQISNDVEALLLRNEMACHRILSHQNIVQIVDHLQTANRLYIVSEFCDGGNLYDYVQRGGRLQEEVALALLLQMVRAVNYIHGKGILHRDIKSGNVLLTAGLKVKLADFGFADFAKPPDYQEQYNVGSPVYMSPEAYYGSQYSTKSDVWSLGMVLFEMLYGGQPFANGTFEAVYQAILSGQLLASLPRLSATSRYLLERMFCPDVNGRADTIELLTYLGQYFSSRGELEKSAKLSRLQYSAYRTRSYSNYI